MLSPMLPSLLKRTHTEQGTIPKFSDDLESFMQSLQSNPLGNTTVGKTIQQLQTIFSNQTPNIDHIQARIPFELNIR